MSSETALLKVRVADIPLLLEAIEDKIDSLEMDSLQEAFETTGTINPMYAAQMERLRTMADAIIEFAPLQR